MLLVLTYLLSLALLCHRSLAFQSKCEWTGSQRPKITGCEAALSQIDLAVDQHWQRVTPVVWVPRQYRSTQERLPTCGQQWSADGCTITLHCTARSKMTLREIYMVSAYTVTRCVRRDQRHSRGGLGYLDRDAPWWISIAEKARSFGTQKTNAKPIPVGRYFAQSQKFRRPVIAPGAGGALRGQGSSTASIEVNNYVGPPVVPADISQHDAYLRDFPPL